MTIDDNSYFATHPEPDYLPELQKKVQAFILSHQSDNRRIALVTSGGTTVPLENNTVRFIDNFSAGTRGAISAEKFLENDYVVIFMHRHFSLLPYERHFANNTLLECVDKDSDGRMTVNENFQEKMQQVYSNYKASRDKNSILYIPFTTVNQYLFTLRMISLELSNTNNSLFYLAAAVSDFFLPVSKVSEHKIQSKEGRLILDLDPVPKFLKKLVDEWAPDSMIVSFKLETDEDLLVYKARQALEKYSHQLVIGNLLQTRKQKVIFVNSGEDEPVEYSITPEQEASGYEIENIIIPKVIEAHSEWISKH